MSEEQTPQTPVSETPVAPAPESDSLNFSESESGNPVAKSTKSETTVTPTKVEAAADKVGAEQVAKDKFELKVDGETLTLSREEMVKYAQLGKAGQKRMQEAIEFQKETKSNWENLQRALKENPESILEDANIGHNKIELAKKWLAEKMEQDQKSPDQLKLEAAMKRSEDLEKQIKARDLKEQELIKRQQQEQNEREIEHNMKALETEMLGAFKKHQLPNSSAMVDRMTGIMEVAERNGIQVSVDDVAKIVRDEIKKDFQELAAMLPDEDFESFMGEGVTKRVKENTLKRAKASPKLESVDVTKAIKTIEKEKPKMSVKDFMKPDWAK